jgi:hypothetical protein
MIWLLSLAKDYHKAQSLAIVVHMLLVITSSFSSEDINNPQIYVW